MPTEKKRNDQIDRRRALKVAGFAIGAAAATNATGKAAVAAPGVTKLQHAGYRETETVKNYYKLARF